jgi:hypothetical protein
MTSGAIQPAAPLRIGAQPNVKGFVYPLSACHDGMGGASRHGAGAQVEGACGTGIGDVNANHDRHTQRDAKRHDGKLDRMPKQRSQGKHVQPSCTS